LANKKITELNNLQTPVANTQFVAVDIENDETKSVTLANLISTIDTNENQNVVQIQSNVASIVDTDGHTVTLSANLIPSADGVYDLGSASKKWKDLHLTGSSIKLGGITISDLGNEGINIAGTSGAQANITTPALGGVANVAQELSGLQSRLTTNVAITTAVEARRVANVTVMTDEDTALQSRLATNVTAFTNEDTALQARIAANTLVAAANDFVTFTRLTANIDLVQDNVAAIVSASAVETRLNANLDVVQDNVAAEATAIQARLTTNVAITTAVEARRVANVTVMTDEDTALQARIAANTLVAAANDFVSFTRLQANIDLVQDNVSTASGGSDGVEARRVANIAGAVSTITTGNLTASRALASDGSGKVGVATTTLAELNHVSGVSGAIQTQLDAVEARRAANNITTTFTDDVVITGNLTINGDTTTVSTTNLDVEDRIIMLADGVSGSPSADVGLLFNRGNQGNAALFYDESAKTFKLSDTKDPKSNTSLSPVTASNLSVGIVDAATLKYDGLSVHTAIADNATVAAAASAAVEARRVANIAGAISTVLTGDLTGDRVMITNGDGKIAASSAVTPTELGMIDGITLGTTAASKAVTSDASGDTSFSNDLAVVANTTLGTNASNTVTIVGILDCGAFS
tara:strand:+ start:9781 stop:11700 length:1920 start_codon:yes stop_codon:yes gene_type:complete